MANPELLDLLVRTNLIGGLAILGVLTLRGPVRAAFGARVAYRLWLIVPVAMLGGLLPARTLTLVGSTSVDAMPTGVPAQVVGTTVEIAARQMSLLPHLPLETLAVLAWGLGALGLLAATVWSQLAFEGGLGRLAPEGAALRSQRSGFGPVVLGVMRPRVVLPADFEARFSAVERGLVLAHEQAHVTAGDHLVNLAAAGLRCLCWFNPLVHLAVRQLRIDQELACDATVVGGRPELKRSYAEAMLKAQFGVRAAPLVCAWPGDGSPGKNGGALKTRIARLQDKAPSRMRRGVGLSGLALLGAAAATAAWAAQPPRVVVADKAEAVARYSGQPRVRAIDAALIGAADDGRLDEVRQLVAAGADVNAYAPGDGTPLIAAARRGDVATARFLIEKGARVDAAARGDGNPLIAAAAHGRLEMAQALVASGADVNAYAPYDETPLINAARSGETAVVSFLLDHGADPNLSVPSNNRPGEMRSPLSVTKNPAISDLLTRRGARR